MKLNKQYHVYSTPQLTQLCYTSDKTRILYITTFSKKDNLYKNGYYNAN